MVDIKLHSRLFASRRLRSHVVFLSFCHLVVVSGASVLPFVMIVAQRGNREKGGWV